MGKPGRPTGRVLAAVLLAAGLAACGGDDDPAVDEALPRTGEDAAGEGDAPEGELARYCDSVFAIETVGEPEIDRATATPEDVEEAARSFASEEMVPLAREIEANVPDEIAEEAAVLIAAVDELAETGDFEAAFDEETVAAAATAHEFDLASCGWSTVDVTAVDYGFTGIDAELPRGAASFELTNDGAELHEIVVLRKRDDTVETWDELLRLPEDQAMPKVSFVGRAGAAPGKAGAYAVADLTPGEYMAICFVPVGSVSEDAPAEGPPHFTQGMKTEFTVG